MPPSKCLSCPIGVNCINGRYCPLFRRYIEHSSEPLGCTPKKINEYESNNDTGIRV
nr:MAG TPA: hypothetical protein [Caudoviricetes sp.]DAX28868.1 MAG TPA: hypothetical protein [Caudoviricetes sp.]